MRPCGASETIRPSRAMIGRICNCSSRHQVTSVRSPKVQHIAMPVPLSGCARTCASTGTSTLNKGVRTVLPKYGMYRSSSGCAIKATQAGRSSGRVVSIRMSPEPSVLWNFRVWYAPGRSRSSSSACATAVLKSTSHSVGASCVYASPRFKLRRNAR